MFDSNTEGIRNRSTVVVLELRDCYPAKASVPIDAKNNVARTDLNDTVGTEEWHR
jgi:hypothetical protein